MNHLKVTLSDNASITLFLTKQSDRLLLEAEQLRHIFSELNQKYRKRSPDLCSLQQRVVTDPRYAETHKPEAPKKLSKEAKRDVKALWKRLANLTHPDKVKHHNQEVQNFLCALYISGKLAYQNGDKVVLEALLKRASRVSSTRSLGSEDYSMFAVPKDEDYEVVELQKAKTLYNHYLNDLNYLKESYMYQVYLADQIGNEQLALDHHRKLTATNIEISIKRMMGNG